ncbi:MAG: hypothetical protein GX961_08940, partial [Firmicutes bacterium]|nr:hypothetical protein [Bacillota bacterium]
VRVTGRPIPLEVGPRRPGDPPVLVASAERARRELGWVPRRPSVEAMIESAWRWRLAHPQGDPAPSHGKPDSPATPAAPPLPEGLARRQETKPDGRYLIYYEFPGKESAGPGEGGEEGEGHV